MKADEEGLLSLPSIKQTLVNVRVCTFTQGQRVHASEGLLERGRANRHVCGFCRNVRPCLSAIQRAHAPSPARRRETDERGERGRKVGEDGAPWFTLPPPETEAASRCRKRSSPLCEGDRRMEVDSSRQAAASWLHATVILRNVDKLFKELLIL